MKNHSHFKRTVRPRCCLLLGLTFAALASFGATEPKAAWDWSIEERLAERFDPTKIKEREEAYIETYGAAHPELRSNQGTPPQTGLRYRIDGARNPELFLPHELFDFLVRGVASEALQRSRVRQDFATGLRSEGFDPDEFWQALKSISAPYGRWFEQRGALSNRDRYDKCHARYVALEGARQRFGREQFDRMLYTVIAPKAQFSAGTTFPNPSDDLRREAIGCQDYAR